MTLYDDDHDELNYQTDASRRQQAPKLQAKNWKQTPTPIPRRASAGPTSYNGMHRRRKKRISW